MKKKFLLPALLLAAVMTSCNSDNSVSEPLQKEKTVEYVKNPYVMNEREVKQTVPVYTVNYKDASGTDAGYVVIAGDERISNDVLIFSNGKGERFDMEKRDDADFLDDIISGYLYYKINSEPEV